MEGDHVPKSAHAAAIALILTLVLVAGPPAARAAIAQPLWRAGFYWLYTYKATQLSGNTTITVASGTWNQTVAGQANVTVGNTTYPSYQVHLLADIAASSGTEHFTGNLYYRLSDLAQVELDLHVTAVILGTTYTITELITYDPPLPLQWPLAPGSRWLATTNATATVTVSGGSPSTTTTTITVNNTVLAQTNRTVSAGTFSTIPLNSEQLPGGTTVQYWSDQVGSWVEQDTVSGSTSTTLGLTAYNYTRPSSLPPQNPGGGILGLDPVLFGFVIGLAAAVVVVLAVIALLFRRRRPPAPAPAPPPPPP